MHMLVWLGGVRWERENANFLSDLFPLPILTPRAGKQHLSLQTGDQRAANLTLWLTMEEQIKKMLFISNSFWK